MWLWPALVSILPIAAGIALAGTLFRGNAADRWPAIAGYGLLFAVFLMPLSLLVADFAGLRFSTRASLLPAQLMALAVIAACWRFRDAAAHRPALDPASALTGVQRAFWWFLLLAVAGRLCLMMLEVPVRPLFPWDATMHWATKAKVWFGQGQLVPFVDNRSWLLAQTPGIFTDHHPGYPTTIPLLQLWTATALQRWDEALINLPWLLFPMALAACFYGQGRLSGVHPLLALLFVYLLVSMPLLNTHVALAGYADLLLGCVYGGALMALHRWQQDRRPAQLALALGAALLATQVKNEGFFWALTLVPGVLAVRLPMKLFLPGTLLVVLGSAVLLMVFPAQWQVAGHSLESLDLAYRDGALSALARHWFLSETWHLFGFLLLLLPVVMLLSGQPARRYLALTSALLAALVLYLLLFTMTKFAYGALYNTACGRIGLHLVPGLLFLMMLVVDGVLRRQADTAGAVAGPARY